jgi:hypothetical protein
MDRRMRKIGIAIFPIILCMLAACAIPGPKIRASRFYEKQYDLCKRTQKIKIALVDFFPLPPDYPEKIHPFELAFSGEVYEDDKTKFRVFIPNNYKEIINLAFAVAFERNDIELVPCQTVTEAILSEPDYIITGVVKDYKVTCEKLPFSWGYGSRWRWLTHVTFEVKVLNGEASEMLLQKEITDNFEHDLLWASVNLHTKSLVWHDINETTYHPLRTLLVYSTHNCASKLLQMIDEICLEK